MRKSHDSAPSCPDLFRASSGVGELDYRVKPGNDDTQKDDAK